jgi:acyl carrier protein
VQTVDDLISAAFSTEAASLSDDDTPESVGGWDSITQLVLLTSLEDEFGIQFSDEEMTNVSSIGDVRRLVASKMSAI